jgi:MFS family permease
VVSPSNHERVTNGRPPGRPFRFGAALRGLLFDGAVPALPSRLRAALGGLPPVYWALLAGMFVNRLASFVATFLGLYLVRARGFTTDEAAPVVALFGVGILVAAPVGGVLADAIGRRPTMLLSFVTGSVAVAALGLVRSPAAIAALTFAASATSELYRPAMNAAVADVVPPPDRARAWGLSYWAMNVGWTAGLALGGFLAARSYTALFLADAATTLTFALIVLRRVPETRPAGTRAHSPLAGLALVLRDGPFVAFLALHLVALAVFVQFQFTLPLDMAAHGLGEGLFAATMAVNGVGVALLQPVQAALLGRREGSRLLAVSALLFGLGYGVNALAGLLPALPVYVLGTVLWTLGEVVGFPVAATLVADLAPPDLRGRYQGAFSMCWGLAFVLSPMVGGRLLTGLGPLALWLACLVAGALVAGGHLAAAPARRRRLAAASPGPAVPPAA